MATEAASSILAFSGITGGEIQNASNSSTDGNGEDGNLNISIRR